MIIAPKSKKISHEAIDVSLIEDGDEDSRIVSALQQDRAEIHHAPRAPCRPMPTKIACAMRARR